MGGMGAGKRGKLKWNFRVFKLHHYEIIDEGKGGIKVGCFEEKSKGISVGQLDSWANYFDQAKERSSDRTKFVENNVDLSYEIAECYIILHLKE